MSTNLSTSHTTNTILIGVKQRHSSGLPSTFPILEYFIHLLDQLHFFFSCPLPWQLHCKDLEFGLLSCAWTAQCTLVGWMMIAYLRLYLKDRQRQNSYRKGQKKIVSNFITLFYLSHFSTIATHFYSKIRRDHGKNFLWAPRQWVGRR